MWQAKLTTGDHHNAMTDGVFLQWLKRRLTPAFEAQFENEKMFLALDNPSYHHCFDEELKVPETLTVTSTSESTVANRSR